MKEEEILLLCMRAGALLLQYGGETSRVEQTIRHLAIGAGMDAHQIQSFVTPTGIFVSMSTPNGSITKLHRMVGQTTLNLDKVSAVNDLSRRFERQQCSIDDALQELDRIEKAAPLYSAWICRLAAFVSSGSFTLFFGGHGLDFISGGVAGLLSELVMEWLADYVPGFLAVLLASLAASLLAAVISVVTKSTTEGAIVIGAVIPLLPGMSVTNSIRDLLAGDLLSGVARGAEALFISGAIAVAVALALDLSAHFY